MSSWHIIIIPACTYHTITDRRDAYLLFYPHGNVFYLTIVDILFCCIDVCLLMTLAASLLPIAGDDMVLCGRYLFCDTIW